MKDFKSIAEKEQRIERIQKVDDRRELKPNGISTGKSRMAKLLLAKLVRDSWKMEFGHGNYSERHGSERGNASCVGSVKERISQDRIMWNMKEDRSKSLRD